MLMMRGLGRTLFAAAKRGSYSPAAGAWPGKNPQEEFVASSAASWTVWKPQEESVASAADGWTVWKPQEEFVEVDRSVEAEKPVLSACRAWKGSDLQYQSWDELYRLWTALMEEKNNLMTEKQRHRVKNLRFPYRGSLLEARKSMRRVKHELMVRANEEQDAWKSAQMRAIVNLLKCK